MFSRFVFTTLVLSLPMASRAAAEVVEVRISDRQVVIDTGAFEGAGAYERITGTIHFAFDAAHAQNASVVDLDLAPVDATGRVTAHADLMILAPVDRQPGSGTALLEVSNRGGKGSLRYFNGGRFSTTPQDPEHFGDGLLMQRGLTVVWVGWQFDVPQEPGRLRLHAPVASQGGAPITGLVRSDWSVDDAQDVLALAHRDHVAYPVLDSADPVNVLTVRAGRLSPRTVIPRGDWHVTDDGAHIALDGGFLPGRIYEFVYRAGDPALVGLGLAAIRDTMSWLKYDPTCEFRVEHGLGVGISQTGRFLRHFVYQGFNTDEQGRKAFDGLLVHSAGAGRGSFNHRFAQPSRDGHQASAFFFPTDLFPFSGRAQRDPVTGLRDGLFMRHLADGNLPKTFFTNTGYEYWGRAASLLHTSLDGSADVELLPHERVYHLRGGQHFVSRFPPLDRDALPGRRGWRGNPLDFLVTERALLVALQDWVERGVEPPTSAYPRVDDGSLVPIDELAFPAMGSHLTPTIAHEAYRADYGPKWGAGIVTQQPPKLGPAFPSLVCQVDRFGNEIAGLPTIETLVPVATFTPWSLATKPRGAPIRDVLTDFYGNLILLPRTPRDAASFGDERPSLSTVYTSESVYMKRVEAAAAELVARRILLPRDVPRVVARAGELWRFATDE